MANRKATRLGVTLHPFTTDETVEDGVILYTGHMIERVDSSGEVRPATAVSGTFVMGVNLTEKVDNTADGETINFIESSVLLMDQDTTITRSSIGDLCYVVDSETVAVSAASPATSNIAGRVVEVPDTSTVFVSFDPSVKG